MMTEDSKPLEIYTIGHGNSPSQVIVDLLHKHGITTLVDVRSVPYSQYTPFFNREVFKNALEQADIHYVFEGEALGGRPNDETCYKTSEVPDAKTSREKFLKLVDYEEVAKRSWYQEGIERLIQFAGEGRTAIMCSEEDPKRCHRSHLIAQTLVKMGITVKHIRRDESLGTDLEEETLKEAQPRQLGLF
jgi:uncharacterized protein (DUF488 family)